MLCPITSVGPKSPSPERRAVATTAFSALANDFFVSLAALIPTAALGWIVLAVASSSTLTMRFTGARILRHRKSGWRSRVRLVGRVVARLVVYGAGNSPRDGG